MEEMFEHDYQFVFVLMLEFVLNLKMKPLLNVKKKKNWQMIILIDAIRTVAK